MFLDLFVRFKPGISWKPWKSGQWCQIWTCRQQLFPPDMPIADCHNLQWLITKVMGTILSPPASWRQFCLCVRILKLCKPQTKQKSIFKISIHSSLYSPPCPFAPYVRCRTKLGPDSLQRHPTLHCSALHIPCSMHCTLPPHCTQSSIMYYVMWCTVVCCTALHHTAMHPILLATRLLCSSNAIEGEKHAT